MSTSCAAMRWSQGDISVETNKISHCQLTHILSENLARCTSEGMENDDINIQDKIFAISARKLMMLVFGS
jgi:hypothetical protein